MNDEVKKAEQTLATLEAKRAACVKRGTELADERAAVALSAHTGDAKAAKRLAEIHTAIATHASELASFDAAIKAASERLQQARRTEAQTQARKAARELLKRANAIVKYAQTLDDANAIKVEASRAIADELTEMRALAHGAGLYAPTHEQFLALGSRADQTAHMATPFAREFGEHLAPSQRRTHSSYAAPWRDAIAKAAATILGEDKQEAA
jgi:hypothetical protein